MPSGDQVKTALQTGYWLAMTAASAKQSGGLKNLYGFDNIKTAFGNAKEAAKKVATDFEGGNRWFRKETLDTLFGKQPVQTAQPTQNQPSGIGAARQGARRSGHISPQLLDVLTGGARPLTQLGVEATIKGLQGFEKGIRTANQFFKEMRGLYKAQNKAEIDRMQALTSEHYRAFNEMYGRDLTAQDRAAISEIHKQAPDGMPPAVERSREALAQNAFEQEIIRQEKDQKPPLGMPQTLQDQRKTLSSESKKKLDAMYREVVKPNERDKPDQHRVKDGSVRRIADFNEYFQAQFVSGNKVDEAKLASAFETTVKSNAREAFDAMYAAAVANPQNAEQIQKFNQLIEQNFRHENQFDGQKLIKTYQDGITQKAEDLARAAFRGELSPASAHYNNMTHALDNLEKSANYSRDEAKEILFGHFQEYLKSIGKGKSAGSNDGTKPETPFRDFLTAKGVHHSPGADTRTVKERTKNFDTTSPAKLHQAIFKEGNKVWAAAYESSLKAIENGQEPVLPRKVVDAIKEVLEGKNPAAEKGKPKSFEIKLDVKFDGAREQLSGYINEAIAKSLETPKEFMDFMALTHKLPGQTGEVVNSGQDATNRGAIFELFYHHKLSRNSAATARNDVYKPEFAKRDLKQHLDPSLVGEKKMFAEAEFGDKNKFIPDRYIADLNAMVNLKTGGYGAASDTEIQLAIALVQEGNKHFTDQKGQAYELWKAGATAPNPNGENAPPRLKYAYLFASNGMTDAKQEVAKLYKRIGGLGQEKLNDNFLFYYLDSNGVMKQYLSPENDSVEVKAIMNQPRAAAPNKP